jgi:hypothetical protein
MAALPPRVDQNQTGLLYEARAFLARSRAAPRVLVVSPRPTGLTSARIRTACYARRRADDPRAGAGRSGQ